MAVRLLVALAASADRLTRLDVRARAEPDLLAAYGARAARADPDSANAGLRAGRPGGGDPRASHFTAPRPARRAAAGHHPGIPSSRQCDPGRGRAQLSRAR